MVEEKIEEYLKNQHCVLWGESYDIMSTEGFRQAKEFILDIMIDLGVGRAWVGNKELEDRMEQVRACLSELEHLTRKDR